MKHAVWPQELLREHHSLSETDFTEDLEKFDVPTLLLHGEDDQVVPVASSLKSARIIRTQEHLLPGRAARHHGHPPGSCQRRTARLPPELAAIATRSAGLFAPQREERPAAEKATSVGTESSPVAGGATAPRSWPAVFERGGAQMLLRPGEGDDLASFVNAGTSGEKSNEYVARIYHPQTSADATVEIWTGRAGRTAQYEKERPKRLLGIYLSSRPFGHPCRR